MTTKKAKPKQKKKQIYGLLILELTKPVCNHGCVTLSDTAEDRIIKNVRTELRQENGKGVFISDDSNINNDDRFTTRQIIFGIKLG